MSDKKVIIPNCRVRERGMEYGIQIPEEFKQYTNALLEWCEKNRGGFVSVMLSPPKKPKSTGRFSQNNHFKGHVRQISVETQNDFHTTEHAILLRALEHGYPHDVDNDGNIKFDLRGDLVPLSTSEASGEDFKILIETVHVVAAELQIRLVEE